MSVVFYFYFILQKNEIVIVRVRGLDLSSEIKKFLKNG